MSPPFEEEEPPVERIQPVVGKKETTVEAILPQSERRRLLSKRFSL
jgi:hypothetical protein